jgi:hypothetical protein
MKMTGQVNAPATLHPGETALDTQCIRGCVDPDPIWTLRKRKSQFLSGIEPRFSNPAHNPAIIDADGKAVKSEKNCGVNNVPN